MIWHDLTWSIGSLVFLAILIMCTDLCSCIFAGRTLLYGSSFLVSLGLKRSFYWPHIHSLFPVRITTSSEVISSFLFISALQLPWNQQDLYDPKTTSVGYAWKQIKITITVAITSANGGAFVAVTWVAHESCLLQWADLNALNNDSVVRSAVCPQCQRPIVVVEDKSMFLQYRDSFERSSSIFIKLMAGATIGGGILTTVYTTLYTLGATTVRFMCSNEMALDILGIVVKDRGVEIKPISIRNALMIPTIPFALI